MSTQGYTETDKHEDIKVLHSMGYAQELERRLSAQPGDVITLDQGPAGRFVRSNVQITSSSFCFSG